MVAPTPYLTLPGTAREALEFYRGVFGGDLVLHDFAEFGRADGPADAIAHGVLSGPVDLFATDAGDGEQPFAGADGLMFSLLGTASAARLREWFAALGEGGAVVDPLVERPWGASDGQVRDRFGLLWLIGYERE